MEVNNVDGSNNVIYLGALEEPLDTERSIYDK